MFSQPFVGRRQLLYFALSDERGGFYFFANLDRAVDNDSAGAHGQLG